MTLPSGWVESQLAEVASVVQGQSPPGDTYNEEGNGLPFLQGKAEFGLLHPTPERWCSTPLRVSELGDVLISIRAPVGPTNLADQRYCIGRGLAAVRAATGISPQFLLHYLRHSVSRLLDQATGTTFDAIGGEVLRAHRVLIPPKSEQERIVDAIESYLTRLDDAVANLERAEAKLKAYRASVLKAAVEGHLVPTEAALARAEKRDYEPADVLLARILKERRRRWEEAELARLKVAGKTPKNDNWKAKYDEPPAPDTTTLPQLPEGWCWAGADMFFWDANYGTSAKCTPDGNGHPVLRIPNVDAGRISLDDLKYAAKEAELDQNGGVEPNDFLFIRTNGSRSLIGRGALIVRRYDHALHFASYLIRLRLVDVQTASEWFALVWHGPSVREQLLKVAASSAGQHNVSLSAASSFAVPLAPAAEQSRILAELDRLTSAAAKAEEQIASDLRRCVRLRQAVLKWAFDGKLVDQDPDEEPAEKLLARIRAERTATEPAKKANGRRRRGSA